MKATTKEQAMQTYIEKLEKAGWDKGQCKAANLELARTCKRLGLYYTEVRYEAIGCPLKK